MNLVGKEFVAARDDEEGVLVLSRLTGAAMEVHAALIVNPYHIEEGAEALYRALTMPACDHIPEIRSGDLQRKLGCPRGRGALSEKGGCRAMSRGGQMTAKLPKSDIIPLNKPRPVFRDPGSQP